MYKRVFFIGLLLTTIFLGSCGNSEAQKKYEQEKQKLEQMKENNRRKIELTIATGASEPEILILQIECAQQEKQQKDKVEQLAKEAGIDE